MNDLKLVAVFKTCCRIKRAEGDFTIALHRNFSRIQPETAEQARDRQAVFNICLVTIYDDLHAFTFFAALVASARRA